MNDYYENLCDEWGKEFVDKYWNYDTIYKGLTVPKFENSDEIATLMFSIGNNSTWNDILVDSTKSKLTVNRLARKIFKNQ